MISHDWKAGATKHNKVSFPCSLGHLPALWSNYSFPWPTVRSKLLILDQKHSLLGWRCFNYWWQKPFEVTVSGCLSVCIWGINWLITARNSLKDETEIEGGGLRCRQQVWGWPDKPGLRAVGGGRDIWGCSVAMGCVWLYDLVLAMQKQQRGQPKKLQWTEQCFTVVPCKGFISIMGQSPATAPGSVHQTEPQNRKPIP